MRRWLAALALVFAAAFGVGVYTQPAQSQVIYGGGRFLVKTGAPGGQTWTCGTGAGDDCTIVSTSHATKGDIVLGTTGDVQVDTVNHVLKVGTQEAPAVPSALVQAQASANAFICTRDRTSDNEVCLGNAGTTGFLGTQTNHAVGFATNNVTRVLIAADGASLQMLPATSIGEGRRLRRAHVQTTNATVTTCATLAIGTSKLHHLDISVSGMRSTSAEAAVYRRLAGYKNNAGTVTLIGAAATPLTAEDAAAWDVTLTISTTNVLVQVTGEAAKTIEWECLIQEDVTSAS